MEQQAANARVPAQRLQQHPAVRKVYFLGMLDPAAATAIAIYERQCTTPWAMLSFDVEGGEAHAFQVLNKMKIIKLAVSLGSTASLAEHPATMTHTGVLPEDRERSGITESMIRLSVGVENVEDLWWELEQALHTQ